VKGPSPLAEVVLDVVGLVPAGALVSYGDVARAISECGVACTARQVARVMSRFGSQVPWWRVVQEGGTLAEPVLVSAAEHLRAEGVPVDGRRVPLEARRWWPDPRMVRDILTRGGFV